MQEKQIDYSVLNGKKIVFLGSSVTRGEWESRYSFADALVTKYGCIMIKQAISGTTLCSSRPRSYVERLDQIPILCKPDLFVCQLSTNDAALEMPFGSISNNSIFDPNSLCGAIEFIITQIKKRYSCPICFYTSPRFDSTYYSNSVALLQQIVQKHDINLIDLWNDDEFNLMTDQKRSLYMSDPIHPTAIGYADLWAPRFAQAFIDILSINEKSI